MSKLQFSENKILKLSNVLQYNVAFEANDFNFQAEIEKCNHI